MWVQGRAIDKDVIEKHRHIFSKKWFEEFVHGGLKGCQRITDIKWHYFRFVMIVVGSKSDFVNIFLGHADLVEPLSEIKFREPGSIAQVVK